MKGAASQQCHELCVPQLESFIADEFLPSMNVFQDIHLLTKINQTQYGLLYRDWRELKPSSSFDAMLEESAARGRLDVVEWLHFNQENMDVNSALIDRAALGGHLYTVEFLHSQRKETCSKAAMDGAAAGGHLDLLQWLHSNRSEGCSRNALNMAASNGHFHVVEWLQQNRTEGDAKAAIMFCSRGGTNKHLRIMEWLRKNSVNHNLSPHKKGKAYPGTVGGDVANICHSPFHRDSFLL